MGSIDQPFNPISVALGAEATFVARTHDMDRGHMQEMFRRAHDHQGSAIVEVFQNCNVFNDGAFNPITKKDPPDAMLINHTHGEPVRFGVDGERGVMIVDGTAKIVDVAEVGIDALHVHDETAPDPSVAFAISRLADDRESPTPVGVFRSVQRREYGDSVSSQIAAAQDTKGPGDLHGLLQSAHVGRELTGWALDLDGVIWRGSETVPAHRLRSPVSDLLGCRSRSSRTRPSARRLRSLTSWRRTESPTPSPRSSRRPLQPQRWSTRAIASWPSAPTVFSRRFARGCTVVHDGPADAVIMGITQAFDYDMMTRAMHAIADGARFIATNTDSTFPMADRLVPGNGALVAAVATATGLEPEIAANPTIRLPNSCGHSSARPASWWVTAPIPTGCSPASSDTTLPSY